MKKYRTGRFGDNPIEEIEISKETDKSVWTIEEWGGKKRKSRCLKKSDWHQYWNTWQEAKDFLMDKALKRIDSAKSNVLLAESYLEKIFELRKEKNHE